MENFLKNLGDKNKENKPKRKIENIFFIVVLLIITIISINTIWNKKENNDLDEDNGIEIKETTFAVEKNTAAKEELETKLESILETIKNVGKVKVFINYSESTSMMPIYDETIRTNTIVEEDSSGGTRNTTETENQKEVIFSENSGSRTPVTQKNIMPKIQGAIITAEGANDAMVKTNIITAIQAVTGLTIDKVQVFEMK